MQTTADEATDWIPVAEAAALIPSPKPGKVTSLSTLYRWIADGRLPCWQRAQSKKAGRRSWKFVRRSDVLALAFDEPEPAPLPVPDVVINAQRLEAQRRETAEGMQRFGLR